VAKVGAFTFVLHSHLPYARQSGMWPHGEEWIHEAIAETYVPLLNALYDLDEEGVPYAVTVGITPILAEQLADPLIIDHFVHYAAERAAWAASDVKRFEDAGDAPMRDLARYYHHWYARALTSFRDRFEKDLVGAFRRLQDAGRIEVSTSAATHGYLPLLARDSSIYGQIRTGIDAYRRRFGRAPKAIWLPECAYRPAVIEHSAGGEIRRPGLEEFLAEQGSSRRESGWRGDRSVWGGATTVRRHRASRGSAIGARYHLPPVLGRGCTGSSGSARSQQPNRAAGMVRPVWVSGRLCLPRVPSQGWRLRYAVLADRRCRGRPW